MRPAYRCADCKAIYRRSAERERIAHRSVNLSAGIRVVDHALHIHNASAYHSRLKGWMARSHDVAIKYQLASSPTLNLRSKAGVSPVADFTVSPADHPYSRQIF